MIVAAALPEDATELSYIEVCRGDEYKEVKENKLSFKEVLSRLAAAAAQIPPVGWFWGSLSSTDFKVKFRAAQQCWERLTE